MASKKPRPSPSGVTPDQIIDAVRRMKKQDRQELLEDLLAATSPEYLASIREAKADIRAGRVKKVSEVFGERVPVRRQAARVIKTCKKAILGAEPRARVFLFGPLVRGEKRRDWDINLLVLLPENSTNTRKLAVLYAVHSVESANGALGACLIETEAFWKARMRNCSHSRAIDREKVAV